MQFKTLVLCGLMAGAASFSAGAAVVTVSYGYYFFNPSSVTINVGDTVSWTGAAGSHTLLGTGSDPICGGSFLPCSHTFNTAGTYAYECTLPGHAASGMTGTVIVKTAAPPPPSPALLTNAMRLANGQFQFTVVTTPNRTNSIQASTNLSNPTNWVLLSTMVPTTTTFTFTDTNASALKLRFYRVIEH